MTNLSLIDEEYYQYLISYVGGDNNGYSKLLRFMFETPFSYPDYIPMDQNRAEDGLSLREHFAMERKYLITDILNGVPCTVLEMLVALSRRIEIEIMSNYSKGDRTSEWFWLMVSNAELNTMNDICFNELYTINAIQRFEYRLYNKDGSGGGLFVIHDDRRDMRTADIWYQMQWYLSEQLRINNQF